MRWAGHIASMEEMRNVYKIRVGKAEGKRPLGRPGLDGRIILESCEVGLESVDWMHLA
jgi:hypothetical protein